jgi:metal-sulfur cluster biosynthetic enzyme
MTRAAVTDAAAPEARSPGAVVTTGAVVSALAAVRDPELDEPITALGFVTSCTISPDGDVALALRLPTYFCAPNFAFLMVADAFDVVSALPGVRSASVELTDHFAAAQINDGVAARAGFARSFAGEAAGELDSLRADFLRKAVLAGTDQVCRPLAAAGAGPGELAAMRMSDAPPSRALSRLADRRAQLGLPAGPDAPLIIDPVTGAGVTAGQLPLHLRKARTTGISVAANTGICRGMLGHRYPGPGLVESTTEEEHR